MLEKCCIDGCNQTVHREDAREYYPCCSTHKEANKACWELQDEKKYHESINKELYSIECAKKVL